MISRVLVPSLEFGGPVGANGGIFFSSVLVNV